MEFINDYISRENNTLYIFWEDLSWSYRILDKIDQAIELITKAIGDWYNIEEYPEYEQLCVGDIIDEYLESNEVNYEHNI